MKVHTILVKIHIWEYRIIHFSECSSSSFDVIGGKTGHNYNRKHLKGQKTVLERFSFHSETRQANRM